MLRTLDDALALRAALERGPRVVVVGAGFIGAEVAATCRRRHLDVDGARGAAEPDGARARSRARRRARRRCTATTASTSAPASGSPGSRRRLGPGRPRPPRRRRTPSTPTSSWWASASCPRPGGSRVRVSPSTTASSATRRCLAAPGIVAAGDVARWPNPVFDGELMRLEHWTNAAEQGVVAAKRLLATDDEAEPFAPVPFVWSDQYDVKIQVAGHVRGDDTMEIVDGSIEERRFVAILGPGRSSRRRGRVQPPPPAHAVPADGPRTGLVRRRARVRPGRELIP